MTAFLGVLVAVAVAGFASVCQAQAYPAKPVRLVAAFPAGTGVDVAARILALKLGERLAQPFLVDNRPGAGGNIAAEVVAKSPPDGYTLLFTNNALTINPNLYRTVPYDAVRSFDPISLAGTSAMIMVASMAVPANSVQELIAWAKARPGGINIASAGNGSPSHLGGALFQHLAAIDLVHVPYKGAPAALTDLAAGQVQLYVSGLPPALAMIRAGKAKAMAVTTAQRSSVAPEVPTFAESGLPGYDIVLWYGLLAPSGTDRGIVRRLNEEVVLALTSDDGRQRFSAQGVDPTSSTQQQFAALIRSEMDRWAELVKVAGVKVD
jgi:tripartite-type tricarboxylate transporter receptor subunit TctC